MNSTTTIQHADLTLTESAVSKRLRSKKNAQPHPLLFLTPLIYITPSREYLPMPSLKPTRIYQQYREIATQAKLPTPLYTPTLADNLHKNFSNKK